MSFDLKIIAAPQPKLIFLAVLKTSTLTLTCQCNHRGMLMMSFRQSVRLVAFQWAAHMALAATASAANVDDLDCIRPTATTKYILDLGDYRGFYALVKPSGGKPRYHCPLDRSCVCDLTGEDGDYIIGFSGAGGDGGTGKADQVHIRLESGVARIVKSPFGTDMQADGNWVILRPSALRNVRFKRGASSEWGLERWFSVTKEMKAAWKLGRSYETKLIRGVRNIVPHTDPSDRTPSYLTVSDEPPGFSDVPTFLRVVGSDPRTVQFGGQPVRK